MDVWALKVDWIFNSKDGDAFLVKLLQTEKLELYECHAIQVMIEFLYKQYRKEILSKRLPVYLLQLIIYFWAILLNESAQKSIEIRKKVSNSIISDLISEDSLTGNADNWYSDLDLDNVNFAHENYILDGSSSWWTSYAKSIAFVNITLTFYSIYMVVKISLASYHTYYKTIWAYFDIAYCLMNGFVSIVLLGDDLINVKQLRLIESILSIIIMGKLIYFSQLVDQIAPLVNIITKIFTDIGWFMFIFIVILLCFAISFYMIGQTQVEETYYEIRKDYIQ